jgi:two-component system, response regulator
VTARPRRSILLVDDSLAELELMKHYLKPWQESGQLHCESKGAEALDYLLRRGRHAGRDEGLPWLVIIDNKMPVMDGIEVVTEMRKVPGMDANPIVMWSGSPDAEDVRRAHASGVTSYLQKPSTSAMAQEVLRLTVRYWMELNL